MAELSESDLIKKLGEYSAKMIKVNNLQELAEVVEETLEEFIPSEWTGLYLFHPTENKLKLLFAKGFNEEEKIIAEQTAMDRHPGKVFREKIEINIPDIDKDENRITVDSPRSFHAQSRLYLPVMNKDECIGTFGVTSAQKNRFTIKDVETLRFVSQLAGVVYANIFLNEERERILAHLRLKERAITASHYGIIITDATTPDNPMIFANSAFSKITGYSINELIGKNCRILQGNDNDQPGLTELRTAIREKRSCKVVIRNYRKDGKMFWNELSIGPIFDTQGNVTNFIGIQSDISSRILSEELLQESNTRLAELIKTIAAGILVEDERRKIVLINNEFCRMFNIPVSPSSLIGADCSKSAQESKHLFTYPEEFVSRIENILHEKRLIKNEELHLTDGRIFERDYVPIFVNENYKGHLWNYRDITERKSAELSLLQERQLLKTIINNIPEPIYVKDNTGKKILVNKAEIELLGAEKEDDVIGFDDTKFYSPDKLHKTKTEDDKIINTGTPILNREDLVSPIKGNPQWVIGSRVPFKDTEGNILGIVGISYNITDRKKMEEELKNLAKIPLENPNPILRTTIDGRITFANPSSKQLLIDMNVNIGDYLPNTVLSLLEQVVKADTHKRFEVKLNKRFYSLTITPILDESYLNIYALDISNSKKMEEKVRELKSFFEQTLEDLPGQITVFDENYRYIYLNKSSVKNNDLRTWLIGKDDYEYCKYRNLDFSIADKRREQLKKAHKNKIPIKFDETMTMDNSTFFFERTIHPILDQDGNVKQFLAYGVDVTTRINTEFELLRIKNQLELVLNTVGEGIITIDKTGQIILVNDEVEKICGWKREELNGKNIQLLMPTRYREQHSTGMQRYLLTRKSNVLGKIIRLEGLKKDNTEFPMQLRIKETIIENDIFFTAAISDITELNKLIKDLQLSNNALSEFAYIASHDLREPLRKISTFGSLLLKSLSDKLDIDDKENLDFMIDGAKRMQRMVDDLLLYSRITTKTNNYSLIDLNELINEIIYFDLSEMINETNAKILIENKLGMIYGERTQIKQLFQNLIGNGIKYRKLSTDPIVKIRSKKDPVGVEFQIEDNGIGIDEKYKDQIFEMFKRLHSKEKYEGSGIGLSICKKIVELYNGEIQVESEVNKGSTFIIRLPAKDY